MTTTGGGKGMETSGGGGLTGRGDNGADGTGESPGADDGEVALEGPVMPLRSESGVAEPGTFTGTGSVGRASSWAWAAAVTMNAPHVSAVQRFLLMTRLSAGGPGVIALLE